MGVPEIQLEDGWVDEKSNLDLDLDEEKGHDLEDDHAGGLAIPDPERRGRPSVSSRKSSMKLRDENELGPCKSNVQLPSDRLEDQMNYEHLRRLETIFEEADQDGGGGLDMDEFRESMKKLMGAKVDDDELEKIFMKVDTNCDGTVDWDEYLSYMLLEYQEKDTMNLTSNEQLFPPAIKELQAKNREPIVRIAFLKHLNIRYTANQTPKASNREQKGKYVTCTRDGLVSFYELDHELQTTHRIETRGKWITDMATMSNINQLIFSTADRDIFIYDLAGGKFERKVHLIGIQNAIMCLDYWFDFDNLSRAILLCGDTAGGVAVFRFFDSIKKGLFPKKEMSSKGVVDIRQIIDKQEQRFYDEEDPLHDHEPPSFKYTYFARLHFDWVRQVMFLELAQGVEGFISCSHTDRNSMHLKELTETDEKAFKGYKRLTNNRNMVFHSRKGFISFNYSREWNLIVTGGLDGAVKCWNPHSSKPAATIRTHTTPVAHISIIQSSGQVISIGQDKSIHIIELRDLSVSQKIAPRASAALMGAVTNCAYFNNFNRGLLMASIGLGIFQNDIEEIPIDKNSAATMARTHDGIVSSALYNVLFNQLVTAGHDGYVIVWDVFSGQKVIQFCIEKGIEITAMCFDESKRRLITGTRTGSIKIWNFNNGALLHVLPKTSDVEITSLACLRGKIIAGGWSKDITVYVDTKSGSDEHRIWDQVHQEDILSMSTYCHQNGAVMVASASYDGDIFIWSLDTGTVLCKLNRIESFSPLSTKGNRLANLGGRTSKSRATPSKKNGGGKRETKNKFPPVVPGKQPDNGDNGCETPVEGAGSNIRLTAGLDRSSGNRRPSGTGASRVENPFGQLGAELQEQPKMGDPLGRRLSQNSLRRSTLNVGDLQAFQHLATKTTDDLQKKFPTDNDLEGNLQKNRTIFFGNAKEHPRGDGALNIKLANLMNSDKQNYWEANTAIDKILFLNARRHHPETASLLASGDLGWVFAWSIHRQGGLLGQFTATSNDDESVTALACSENAELLITADSEGYIRAWNIESYCVHNSVKKQRQRGRGALPKIAITEDVVLSDRRKRQINNIPPDQIFAFRAHLSAITLLDYCNFSELVISAATDGTVRMWSMSGKYIGTFGQKRLWNIRSILDDPRPPNPRLPPDVKRIASYETLRLFNQGINSWKLAKNILNILTIKNRIVMVKKAMCGGQEEKRKKEENLENESRNTLQPTMAVDDTPSRRKSFVGSTRKIMNVAALSRPPVDDSVEVRYQSCLDHLQTSRYIKAYESPNLSTNYQYELLKRNVNLRRVLASIPILGLTEVHQPPVPQLLNEKLKSEMGYLDGQGQNSTEFDGNSKNRAKKYKNKKGFDNFNKRRSIRSVFAETARAKKVIGMFKKNVKGEQKNPTAEK